MQHSQRLDQRLHMLREEVRTMTQEKERGEHIWKERLQRCQRQLKAKEEEMIRQSQYFENFKTQLQHKLSLAQDKEQSLQNRIYTLEKQLLDMTVSAASGTTIGTVRITAGTITCWEQQERLTFIRGEGEGEEEKKEEKRRQLQPSIGIKREGVQGKTEIEIVGGTCKDSKLKSNEARLQGFILSLQEDLRVLLEREEEGMTERRRLMEQLQEAQESSHFLGCQVEERKVEVEQLKLSETSLMEEVEGLREENKRLKKISRETANDIPTMSSLISKSITSVGTSSSAVACPLPPCTLLCATGTTSSSVLGSEQVQPTFSEEEDWSCSSAVSLSHQAKAQVTQSNTNGHTSSAKLDPLNLCAQQGSKPSANHQPLSLTTETVDEFKIGTWCSRGILNLEENPSEESDALKEAYRSLWLQGDLEPLQEQNNSLETGMHYTQQENTKTHFQLRNDAEDVTASEEEHPGEKDYLVQALNLENRALADRIQELLAHIELKEQEIKKKDTQMREHISSLEEDRVRLQQENEEQECLMTELTRKTEDDLNTIMDLQQKLEESKEQHNQNKCVDGLVESMLKGEEAQLSSSQQIDVLNRASALKSQHDNHSSPLKSNPNTNNLDGSSDTDQSDRLTRLIHTLKTEQDELLSNIHSLREQQREVALSVQTQTEEKQQITRAVWGLKEEKDRVSQSLPSLKQEKEELSRIVIGLKHGRDHLVKSMGVLKEEKEQLTKVLIDFKSEKKELIDTLSSEREERDQVQKSLEHLQMELDQLRQQVLNLKQERDELNISLSCLKEQRDQHHSFFTYQNDHNKLIKSVTSLKEEKQQTELSISCLKQEEKHIRLGIQHLKEKKNSLQTPLFSQTQTEESKQDVHPSDPICVYLTKKTDTPQTTEDATQRCQTIIMKANCIQEQSNLTRENEALGEQLKKSQEELQTNQAQIKTLLSELSQSEGEREKAERKATQAAEKVMRLTDVANQMEETRIENESLNSQVKELQGKLKYLVKEKTDILSLKKKMEEQYNTLAAQLKAKTVALEELNKEYIGLKQGQSSKDELSTLLMSLQTRYNDIRERYDALRRKSHTDLDVAPLKAKLSCLVVKCQERNSLLVQMMKAMRQHGFLDSALTQQVDYLLRDAALQDYTATFAPGSGIKTWDYSSGFTPGFISKFQEYTHESTSDLTCPVPLSSVNKQNVSTSKCEEICKDFKSQKKKSSHTATESTTIPRSCSSEITPATTGTITTNANSPEPVSSGQDYTSGWGSLTPDVSMTEGIKAGKVEMSVSASKTVYAVSGSEETGFQNTVKIKDKSLPNLTNSTGSSASAASVTSRTCVSPSRRLRSPEKIINLHEQLQKTLMSSYEAPVSRGRGQQPRKSLSFSSHGEQNLASQRKNLNLSFNSTPVTTASIQITTESQAISRSATLFNAVSSRSANLTLSPNMLMNNLFKADMAKTTFCASSSSIASNTTKSMSSSDSDLSIPPTPTKEVMAIPDISDVPHSASPPLPQRATSFDSNTYVCSDTDPKPTASETTASRISAIPKVNIFNTTSKMDGASNDGYLLPASCIQSTYCSPKSSNTSASASLERKKTSRPKPEAPLEVHSLEVLKTVGTSSLMVGWERPPLDELGCSNGTFVYGYRVFIDGDFHKSVMSSACTKCILESVDLNVPVQISVQTLGSNGLTSNFVHTTYIKGQH